MTTVMLIDDHPVVRAGLRAILNSFPNIEVVHEGSNGREALDLLHTDPATVDVIIMDIQMPVMDGVSATQAIVEMGGPPVLVLTTYDTQADIVAAVRAGARGYLLKDAPEQALHEAVLNTAAGKRTISPEVASALAQEVTHPDEQLSAREVELLMLLETGASNREIAASLFISLATVKTHLVHIYRKLGVDNRTAAVREAKARRLIPGR